MWRAGWIGVDVLVVVVLGRGVGLRPLGVMKVGDALRGCGLEGVQPILEDGFAG